MPTVIRGNAKKTNRICRVLLVDDHPGVLAGIVGYLRCRGNVRIVGQAINGTKAIKKIFDLKLDIVVLDLSLPDMNGLEIITRMRNEARAPAFVVYTMHQGSEYVRAARRANAAAFVLKSSPLVELARAIFAVHNGGSYLDRKFTKSLQDEWHGQSRRPVFMGDSIVSSDSRSQYVLTAREKAILRLMADGLVLKEIAARLGISYNTATAHSKHIYTKLGIHTLGAAIGKALRENLL